MHDYVRLSNVGSGDLNSEEQALLLTEPPPQPTTHPIVQGQSGGFEEPIWVGRLSQGAF